MYCFFIFADYFSAAGYALAARSLYGKKGMAAVSGMAKVAARQGKISAQRYVFCPELQN